MKSGTTRFLGIALFVAMGVSALVLGVMGAGNNIKAPLKLSLPSTADQNSNGQVQDLLKSKDTDGDGLSDYDELNVYQTSAYIKDSDSDGIDDGTEVKNGTDPNCPQGQNCNVPAPINNTPDVSAVPNIASPTDPLGALPVATPSNIAEIRQFLNDQGLAEEIKLLDDQTLINMYNESLPAATANLNTNN